MVVTGHNSGDDATSAFHFRHVPSPSKTGTAGKFTIVDGEMDGNGGDVEKLNDGRMPTEEDQPEENFFFTPKRRGAVCDWT